MATNLAMVEFTRAYLAGFFTFVAVFYTLRIIARKRAVGRELVFPGERFCATWWNHMLFRAFRVAIWMLCLWRWLYPGIDGYLGVFDRLQTWPVVLTGNILLTAGFLFTLAVHFSLGRDWRSGIDPAAPEKLATGGFYRHTRNPMFVGIAGAQAGFFLALPSVFTALCLLFGWYTLRRQALAEETHLRARFPVEYPPYQHGVRRWL